MINLKNSPRNLLSLVGFFALALVILSAYVSLNNLVTGIQYVATDLTQKDAKGITIKKVQNNSSAQISGLAAGMNIVAIRGVNSDWFSLKPTDVIEEPDLLPSYQAYFTFLKRQDVLYHMMDGDSFELKDAEGNDYHLQSHFPKLTELPFIYWFQVLCGLIAVLTGFSVYVFRQDDPASLQYALNGVSFLLITLAASIYSSRELALPSDLFYFLNIVNHLGALIFSATFISLFFLYPKRLTLFPWQWVFLATFVLLAIADWLVLFDTHDDSIRLPILIALLLSVVLAAYQRYKNRHKMIEKAALRWFVLSLLIGGGLFVSVSIFQSYIGIHSEIPQGYSLGFVLIMYLGIALGITRYKLFQLESWWLNIWMWLMGGCVLILFDAFLTYTLGLRKDLSIGMSLVFIGWLYFPVRQWVAKKLFYRKALSIQDVFPQILTLLLSSSHKQVLVIKWKDLLSQIFQPIQIITTQSAQNKPSLSVTGELLFVPSIDENTLFELHYPEQGKRFFTAYDLTLAEGLWQLLSHALREKNAFEKGTKEERKRIGRDLHDDIGTRLLTLMHKTEETELVDIAKDAMRDLRVVLNSLDDHPRVLIDSLGDWRGEIEERCLISDVALDWQQSEISEQALLTSRQYINIQRVLRETITNALKHAQPTFLTISIEYDALSNLCISIIHDGCSSELSEWQAGRGLSNIDFRLTELSGYIERQQNNDQITVSLEVPISIETSF